MKIAIVATHGVAPQTRYGFQDEVARALCDALNAARAASGAERAPRRAWQTSVVFPVVAPPPVPDPVAAQKPQIARIYRAGDDPESPQHDFFDIHEAYWSPISKGKTSPASVVAWLVRTIFLPLNDVARYMARPGKTAWDIGFLLAAVLLGVTLLGGAFITFVWSVGAVDALARAVPMPPVDATFPFLHADYAAALAYLTDPAKLAAGSTLPLLAGIVGAYLFAQACHAVSSLVMHARELLRDRIALQSRVLAVAVLFALACAALVFCAIHPLAPGRPPAGPIAILLAFAFLFLKGGQSLALWFVANFFGDIQIYTTRDSNSSFFALREAILEVVIRAILDVIATPPGRQSYDRVYVLAHSLGSTISLDALLRIANMQREGLVEAAEYRKVRAFITFGSPLEKTKYFFDVWNPTMSQQYDEWRDDLYGALFTADPAALEGDGARGMYWLNCSYFSDFLSNEIASYRSVVLPNEAPSIATRVRAALRARPAAAAYAGRLVACNRERFGPFAPWKFHFVTHGDYLRDPWFWKSATSEQCGGALEVVTSALDLRSFDFRGARQNDAPPPSLDARVQVLDSHADPARYETRDIVRSDGPA